MIEGRAMSEICRSLAEAAAKDHHDLLAQMLRMASLAAAETGARYVDPVSDIQASLVGTWDWDIVNDRVYADGPSARLFGISDQLAAGGAPIAAWMNAVHPADRAGLQADIEQIMQTGDVFSHEYRTIANGRTHWVYARGRCTFDAAGAPVRFPGAFVDITRERSDDNSHLSIAPR